MKFRIWDKQEKKWYKPTFEAHQGKIHQLLLNERGELVAYTQDGMEHESLWKDRYVVNLFTGLLDEAGKEIYTDDLVRASTYMDGQIVEVKLQDGSFYPFDGGDLGEDPLKVLVVGNIYENPELLEVENGS